MLETIDMKFESYDLLNDLEIRTKQVIEQGVKFQNLPIEILNKKMNEDSWSVLECLEHLNLYGRFYLPEIENRIASSNKPTTKYFRSGILGNYFANSMKPKAKLNKMKTFKSMNPLGSSLGIEVIELFLNQQQIMLRLLESAKHIDLTKVKTSISISNYIKLRLGDTFRVVIYHNERHMVQANKILNY